MRYLLTILLMLSLVLNYLGFWSISVWDGMKFVNIRMMLGRISVQVTIQEVRPYVLP